MRPTDIIMKKRGTFIRSADGKQTLTGSTALSREEIKFLVDSYVAGTIPDYQMSSWLMAVYFNGMSFEETGWLTDAMLHSGDVINLHGYEKDGLTGPFVDKHSTGGVGDKISLPLAPIVACCGIQVPMMSGRALGHTGGTLDKLESIEGYKVGLTPDTFRSLIAKTGFAMTGQTKEIVPADRLLYALRDVTGDPWNGRTLEWSTSSPPPAYNFAFTPVAHDIDAWWDMKQHGYTRPTSGFQPIPASTTPAAV